MRGQKELERLIESERAELDAAVKNGRYENCYQKSQSLDKLIEEYLDAKEANLH